MGRFRRPLRVFFARGLAGLLPTLLTIFILITGFTFLDDTLGKPIYQKVLTWFGGGIAEWMEAHAWVRPVMTVGVSVAIVFVVGFFLTSLAGSRIYRFFEKMLFDIPVVKKIYPSAKQLTDFFFAEKPAEWTAVVAMQYPRVGMWSLGFLMGDAPEEISRKTGERHVSVYAPTSPVPFTGYVMCVPVKDVMPLQMSVEDALQWIISAGVVRGGKPGMPGSVPPPRLLPPPA